MKNTLLMVAGAPGIRGVGGVLLREMLAAPRVEPVDLLALVQPGMHKDLDRSRLRETRLLNVPELPPRSPGRVGSLRAALAYRTHICTPMRKAAAEALPWMTQRRPEHVWVIANSVPLIELAGLLLPSFRGRVRVQIWDDPAYLAEEAGLDRISTRRVLAIFHALLRRADRVAVIGTEMAKAYEPFTRAPMTIIQQGCPEMPAESIASDPTEFRIGFAGSMYAHSAWRALQSALDAMEWTLDGRPVSLVTVGGHITFRSRHRASARFYGWRSQDETLALLRSCDLLYLPQAFESSRRRLTELSFPTKLTTYAAAGRPVLLHAPPSSTLANFQRLEKAGVLCPTLGIEDVMQCLKSCADPATQARETAAMHRIAREVLTRAKFESAVQSFLGVEST